MRAVADVVLTSGGIGPTHDDLTRGTVAEALGLHLVRHAEALERVERWYGAKTTEAERTMADLPEGSVLLRGARTDTLGFAVANVVVLPGVPFLLRDLVDGSAERFAGPPLHREEVHTDLREGEVAPALTAIQAGSLDVAIGSYPILDGHRWWTKVVVRGADASRVAAVASSIRSAFGGRPDTTGYDPVVSPSGDTDTTGYDPFDRDRRQVAGPRSVVGASAAPTTGGVPGRRR